MASTDASAGLQRPPSTVNANLGGPDGVARTLFSGGAAPGTYPFSWSGKTAEGVAEPEGAWRWVLGATDDLGRASSFERPFFLNSTLGFGRGVSPFRPRVSRVVAQFARRAHHLAHRIACTAFAPPAGALQPGRRRRGTAARKCRRPTGIYVARMMPGTSSAVSLTAKFSVRRNSASKASR
jgi:hypothetical protein